MQKIYTSLFLFYIMKFYAQNISGINYDLVNIKSPESYNIEKITNVPINEHVGTINYTFPLFNINNNNFFLNFDSSGFKPAKRESIFGLNWNSNVFGAITREVNGVPDDNGKFEHSEIELGILEFINKKVDALNDREIFQNSRNLLKEKYKINNTDYEAVTDHIIYDHRKYEIKSDKYYFNFLNISGYFYLALDGSPIVISETPGLTIDISGYKIQYDNVSDCIPANSEIVITDGNGIKYFFGGSPSALEIDISLGSGNSNEMIGNSDFLITGWYVTKVLYPTGKEINYEYEAFDGYEFCQHKNVLPRSSYINLHKYMFQVNKYINQGITLYELASSGNGFFREGTSSDFNKNKLPYYQYSITKLVKLNKIKYDGNEIAFNYKLNIDSYGYNKYTISNISHKNFLKQVIDDINFNIEPQGNSNLNGGISPRYFLNYIDKNNLKYRFEYYSENQYPIYETRNIDYWGFWNGSYGESGSLIPSFKFNTSTGDVEITSDTRKERPYYSNVGNLKKVINPTGGYQEFFYEPHTYGKKLIRNYSTEYFPQLISLNETTSGTRVYKTNLYNSFSDASPIETIEYDYHDSGILTSLYDFITYINRININSKRETIYELTSNNFENSMFSTSKIGYSHVSKSRNGIIQNEYKFTDYKIYPDKHPNLDVSRSYITYTYDPIVLSYRPANYYHNKKIKFIDQSYKRGKISEHTVFRDGTDVIESTKNYYMELNNGYHCTNVYVDSKYKQICKHLSDYYTTSVNSITTGVTQLYKNTLHPFVLSEQVNTKYFGSKSIKSTSIFDYRSSNINLISTVYEQRSQGWKVIEYLYPQDLHNHANIDKLITSNRIIEPLITKHKIDGKYISEIYNQYSDFNSNIQKSAIYQKKGSDGTNINTPEYLEITYDSYDSFGNVTQYTIKNGIPVSIIWGYKGMYPVAKIEGLALSNINQSIITTLNNSLNDSDLITAITNLRDTYTQVMVTGYLHKPLVGVTKIIDPNGQITTYNYDENNRLKNVIDHQGNVISENQYHYKN